MEQSDSGFSFQVSDGILWEETKQAMIAMTNFKHKVNFWKSLQGRTPSNMPKMIFDENI